MPKPMAKTTPTPASMIMTMVVLSASALFCSAVSLPCSILFPIRLVIACCTSRSAFPASPWNRALTSASFPSLCSLMALSTRGILTARAFLSSSSSLRPSSVMIVFSKISDCFVILSRSSFIRPRKRSPSSGVTAPTKSLVFTRSRWKSVEIMANCSRGTVTFSYSF